MARFESGPILARRETTPVAAETTTETPAAETSGERGIVVLSTGEAWVEVRDRDNAIVFSQTMKPGQEVSLPDQTVAPKVHTGNAGATFVIVNGVAYGPLGDPVQIKKNFALTAENIRKTLPKVDVVALRTNRDGSKVLEVPAVAKVDNNMVLPPKRPKR